MPTLPDTDSGLTFPIPDRRYRRNQCPVCAADRRLCRAEAVSDHSDDRLCQHRGSPADQHSRQDIRAAAIGDHRGGRPGQGRRYSADQCRLGDQAEGHADGLVAGRCHHHQRFRGAGAGDRRDRRGGPRTDRPRLHSRLRLLRGAGPWDRPLALRDLCMRSTPGFRFRAKAAMWMSVRAASAITRSGPFLSRSKDGFPLSSCCAAVAS